MTGTGSPTAARQGPQFAREGGEIIAFSGGSRHTQDGVFFCGAPGGEQIRCGAERGDSASPQSSGRVGQGRLVHASLASFRSQYPRSEESFPCSFSL
jgi:hypothetical protein